MNNDTKTYENIHIKIKNIVAKSYKEVASQILKKMNDLVMTWWDASGWVQLFWVDGMIRAAHAVAKD